MRAAARLKQRLVHCLAASYVAGADVESALAVCRRAAAAGWLTTICPWDDPADAPRETARRYLAALCAIRRARLACYLSVKAPALAYDYALFDDILQQAREFGIRVHFDSHQPDSASPTFKLIERGLRTWEQLGCTLPSCWRRSLEDAERVMEWGIPVRIVKGQFPETTEGAMEPRAGFLAIAGRLAGRARLAAVATHDTALASEAIDRLRQAGTAVELEQLFGLPVRTRVAARSEVSLRLYVAYGRAWLPYCLSQIGRRPVILAWVLRDLLFGSLSNLSGLS